MSPIRTVPPYSQSFSMTCYEDKILPDPHAMPWTCLGIVFDRGIDIPASAICYIKIIHVITALAVKTHYPIRTFHSYPKISPEHAYFLVSVLIVSKAWPKHLGFQVLLNYIVSTTEFNDHYRVEMLTPIPLVITMLHLYLLSYKDDGRRLVVHSLVYLYLLRSFIDTPRSSRGDV